MVTNGDRTVTDETDEEAKHGQYRRGVSSALSMPLWSLNL